LKSGEFTRRIGGFAGLSHPDKITLFAWYLHTDGQRERFDAAEIGSCYDGADLERPANLHLTMKQLTEKSPPVLLRDSRGYRLESRIREALDEKHGQSRDQLAVSKAITDLIAKVPSASEKAFLTETSACYRCRAFRAAIVMAWALAMDHVLEWILSDATRLAAFNARIPQRFPKKTGLVINDRIGFQELKESELIDVLSAEGLISRDTAKVLREKLDKRNSAAHPSNVVFTQAQAEDVITDLVYNVVLFL